MRAREETMSITLKKPHFRARLFGVLAVCTVAGIVAPAHAAHDTDLDGVTNEDEASLGTNPNLKDTDGDGIPDNVELSTTGGAGPFQLVNSDADFTIDALDLDSDNDCVLDSAEGA